MINHYRFIFLFVLIVLQFTLLKCTTEDQVEVTQENYVLQAVEEVRIGQLEGENEYVFGSIGRISIGGNGEMFVADPQVPVIRMYDREGNFIRNIGGEGRGPGEYSRISGMRTFPDGRLAVWDVNNQRVNVYSRDGDYVENYTVNSTLHSADNFEVGHDGNFYVKTALDFFRDISKFKLAWLRISPEGEITDTLKVPFDEVNREQSFVLFTASGRAHAFINRPINKLSTKGNLITGKNDQYVFQINQPDSFSLYIERDFASVQVKPEEKEQWEDWINYFGVNNNVPEIKPPVKDITTDSQGRIWVKRYVEAIYTEKNIGPHFGPESRWWEPPVFDVFLPDGTFYATVSLPINANFRDAKDNFVWAVIKGEYDEQYVARFRLEEVMD
ncbi:MAG: 6-bladed beta-propeller [Balneolaceae bacterium]